MKIARDTTQVEFDTIRPRCQLAPEDEKDIYMTTLTDMMRSSFENSEAYRTLGIPVAKSILIHGVSGVGKTRLVQCASETLASTVYDISIHDLLVFNDQEYDVPEFMHYNPFTLLLEKAKSNAPATLIVRHLDALLVGDKTNKILDIISKGIDGIQDTTPVCIVGLARHLTALPESLRKTDIFRQHMTLPIPTLPQRKALLHVFLKDMDLKPTKDTTTATTLNYYATQISMRTSGYVARDLKRLVRQAKLKAMRSNMDIADQLEQLSLAASTTSGKVAMAWCDFEYALDTYRPSQRAEVESTLPKRSWDDMGGYTAIKDRMKQAILLPLLQPHVFTKLGIKPPSGLLLYGPSGCGKTALVQALVSESMMNIISIRGPEIFSKYLGETENKLRKLFATAKRIAPCIVFIDEMDAIGTKRGFDMGDSGSGGGVNERVLSTLLNEMDGVENRQGVVVIGCTNRPDQMDDAILRPGRLDQLVHVGLPSLQDRIDIIHALLKKTATQGIDVQALASQTEFCSGADLENLFREAGTAALRKDLNASCITPDDIASVIVPICERAEDQVLEGRLDLYEKFLHDHSL
ncbi:P-loop containing nucleoside triphosphate hydrolase protein [Mucor lusitanicus]|nr:P-loop containing nucleoside triphosphate hydrolase protein [Mucor lusitanicus]